MGRRLVWWTSALFGMLLGACSEPSVEPAGETNSQGGADGLPSETDGGNDSEPPATGGSNAGVVRWNVVAESTDSRIFATTPAAASRGIDGAVAYVEHSDDTPGIARVVLQRFDAQGKRVGTPLVLGTDSQPYGAVTLASDGTQYAACWDSTVDVRCSLLDGAGTVQESILALAGQHPALVAAPSGWVLAYVVGDTTLRLQPLTSLLQPTGVHVDFERASRVDSADAATLLAATDSGFALIGARADDGHDGLLRLGVDLRPLGPAIPLGRDYWFYGQLVASDERAAVSLSAPYGSYLLLLDTERVTAELPIGGGGKTGMDQALLLTEGAIDAAWLTRDGDVQRRVFENGRDGEVGLSSRGTDDLLGLPQEGTDSYQQLLKVEDQTLLVARNRRYGYLGQSAIRVAPLTFP